MRITTRLAIISAGTLGALVLLLLGVGLALAEFRSAKADFLLADQLQDTFIERTAIRDEYLLYRENRTQAMWEQRKSVVDQLVGQARRQFRQKADLQSLETLCRSLDENSAIFYRIVANTARLNPAESGPSTSVELDRRLTSQLLMKAMAVRNTAAELQNSTSHRVDASFRRLALMVGLFGLLVALITILTTQQLSRLIRRRLGPLHTGLRRVAEGDLGHRIVGAGSDEFSELARSVNTMTEQLQGSTRQLGEEIGRRLVVTAEQEHARRIHAWFELPVIGICMTSPEKGWLEVNDHLCTLLGYGREELLTKTWAELTHPEDLQVDVAQFERVLRGELEGYALEKRFLRKDGGTLPAELAVRCLRKGDGSVDYFVALIQDNTERKRLEEERLVALRSLQDLETIDGILRRAGEEDLLAMNEQALRALLGIFHCDRAWLIHPVDPEAPTWTTRMEVTQDAYPGLLQRGLAIPMSEVVRDIFRAALASEAPIAYGPGQDRPTPSELVEAFGVQSQLTLLIPSKHGQPWLLGLHQCSHPRLWTRAEKDLFSQIGQRLTEGLNAMQLLETLQESEQKYRGLVDNLSAGVVVHGPDTAILFANAMAGTLLGLTADQLQGKTALDPRWCFLKDDGSTLPLEEYPVHRVLASGQGIHGQVLGVCRPELAEPVWVLCNAFPDRDEKGAIRQTVVTFSDITERRLAVAALRRERERVERYLRVAEVMLVAFDAEARITLLNRKGYAVLGYEEGELEGQDWFRVCLPPEDSEMVRGVYRHILTGDLAPVERFENHILRKDGEKRLIAWHNTMLRDDAGRIIGTLSSGEDITDRRQAEAETADLQARLQQSQKMESLGVLAGGVAHDMNNVLGAILSLSSAHLEIQPAATPTFRAFETITKAANRGREMVKKLLGFARKGLVETSELDLNLILREEISLLERTTLARVRLVVDLAEDLRPMRGDASALSHAFMNLCVNAVDAMPDQGTLTLRTRNVDNGWLEVQVEDSGAGMSQEILAKALDPFFTTKGVGKGTGLGLSLVYSTVQAHLGQLDIQSEPGRGTCVRLRFPACTPEPIPVASLLEAGVLPSGRSLKVLLVDDDDLIRTSSELMLDFMGHATTLAASGEEALAALAAGLQPDVVILDMNMPGLGGLGTLPRLRLLQPNLPVLLATGRVDQVALDLVQGDPQVFMMPKPFSLVEFKQYLEGLGLG